MKKHRLRKLIAGALTAALCAGMLPAAFAADPNIPEDAVQFDGHSYQVYPDSMHWEDAKKYCEQLGGHLVSITSAAEQEFLESYMQDKTRGIYMVGLHRDLDDLQTWVTGEAVSYANWGNNAVDNANGRQNIGVFTTKESSGTNYQGLPYTINYGEWDDHFDEGFGFICEWDTVVPKREKHIAGQRYSFNGKEYAFFDDGMTWEQAEKACEKTGGHLVTIASQDEQDFVYSLIQDGSKISYWIGLNDVQTEGKWQWVTGEAVSYLNWDKKQPDNDNRNGEDFAGITRIKQDWADVGYWNDFSKDGSDTGLNNIGYVCEWDNLSGSVPTETKPEPEPQKPASKDTTSFGSHVSEWSAKEMEKAYEMKLIPEKLVGEDLTRQINRAEFAAVAVKTYESLSGVQAIPAVNNPFTDCRDTEVLKAYGIGAVKGISDTQFAPNALLNREQAAAMLTRVFKRVALVGWTLDTDSQFTLPYDKLAVFADDADISGWAKDSVYFMVANQIISGTGNNKFAPKNVTTAQEAQGYANATREQALAIAVRMVENLGD